MVKNETCYAVTGDRHAAASVRQLALAPLAVGTGVELRPQGGVVLRSRVDSGSGQHMATQLSTTQLSTTQLSTTGRAIAKGSFAQGSFAQGSINTYVPGSDVWRPPA